MGILTPAGVALLIAVLLLGMTVGLVVARRRGDGAAAAGAHEDGESGEAAVRLSAGPGSAPAYVATTIAPARSLFAEHAPPAVRRRLPASAPLVEELVAATLQRLGNAEAGAGGPALVALEHGTLRLRRLTAAGTEASTTLMDWQRRVEITAAGGSGPARWLSGAANVVTPNLVFAVAAMAAGQQLQQEVDQRLAAVESGISRVVRQLTQDRYDRLVAVLNACAEAERLLLDTGTVDQDLVATGELGRTVDELWQARLAWLEGIDDRLQQAHSADVYRAVDLVRDLPGAADDDGRVLRAEAHLFALAWTAKRRVNHLHAALAGSRAGPGHAYARYEAGLAAERAGLDAARDRFLNALDGWAHLDFRLGTGLAGRGAKQLKAAVQAQRVLRDLAETLTPELRATDTDGAQVIDVRAVGPDQVEVAVAVAARARD